MFAQKAFLVDLFSEGLIIRSNFVFQNGLRLTSLKDYENSLNQQTPTVHGLTLGRAYYRKDFCV